MADTFKPIRLGPCSVQFGAHTIEMTKGGVVLHVEPELKEVIVDQYGTGPADHRITGWRIRAVVPIAKTDYDTMLNTLTYLSPSGSGLEDKALGSSMRENGSEELILHPIDKGPGDTSEDVKFYKAAPISAVELEYGFENSRIMSLEFFAYPKAAADPSQAGNYVEIGDGDLDLWAVTFAIEDASTDPVAGVAVSLAGVGGFKLSNSAGEVVWMLPDGDYIYKAEKAPYNIATGTLTVAGADLPVPVTMTI